MLILDKLNLFLFILCFLHSSFLTVVFFVNEFFGNSKLLWKHAFYNRIFINSLVFRRWVFIKWEQNYIPISTFFSNDNTYFNAAVLLSWFKIFDSTKNTESRGRWKTSFIKHIVENTDLNKPVSNKIMTTQE